MDNLNEVPKPLKWGVVGLAAVAIGFFVAPIVAAAAWNMVNALIAAATLIALCFLLPVAAEFFGLMLIRLKELIWRTNPVQKLWKDLYDFGKEIDSLETNIANVAAEESNAKMELNVQKTHLDPEEIFAWNEDIGGITSAKLFLIEERDKLREDYNDMERLVRKNEAHWKMAKALGRAADAVNKAGKIAAGTEGGRVSMTEIQTRLATARGKLEVLKTRKSAKDVRKTMTVDTTAKVVPDPKAITNTSGGFTIPVTAAATSTQNVTPVVNQSLLDRI